MQKTEPYWSVERNTGIFHPGKENLNTCHIIRIPEKKSANRKYVTTDRNRDCSKRFGSPWADASASPETVFIALSEVPVCSHPEQGIAPEALGSVPIRSMEI